MGTPTLWIAFNACVLALLVLDLGLFQRRPHVFSLREAAAWSAVWVSGWLSGFNLWILRAPRNRPRDRIPDRIPGRTISELSTISFVFLLVFRSFGVEPKFQHRVLFWGVMGALVMRGSLIAIGTELVSRFSWLLVVLGALLVVAGARMLFHGRPEPDPKRNPVLRWARAIFPVSHEMHSQRFFVHENGRRAVTTLFLALLVLESADLIFALDSVPAIFGITRDPFLVYTSNVCAIVGLRAFYFLLAGTLPLLRFINVGIASVLIFIGGKMVSEPWLHVPTGASLAVVGTLLGVAIAASLLAARKSETTHA